MDQTNVQKLVKNLNTNVVQIFTLAFKCESQSRPENQMEREISSHCDKNSSHNIGANTDEYP